MKKLLLEASYLLTKWGPQECPDWIEGIGDCGKCPECRVFGCIEALDEFASQQADSVDGILQCKCGGYVDLNGVHQPCRAISHR